MNYKEIDNKDIEILILEGAFSKEAMTENKEYLNIYSLYRKFYTEYIYNTLDLKKYESKLKASGLQFKGINDKNKDFFQRFSNEILEYFFIRNILYIDELNNEEIDELRLRVIEKKYIFDEKAEKLIEETYKKVLKRNNIEDSEIIRGIVCENYLIKEGTLILGMRYNSFTENGLSGSKWLDDYISKLKFLEDLFLEIKKDVTEKLLIPVEILRY